MQHNITFRSAQISIEILYPDQSDQPESGSEADSLSDSSSEFQIDSKGSDSEWDSALEPESLDPDDPSWGFDQSDQSEGICDFDSDSTSEFVSDPKGEV